MELVCELTNGVLAIGPETLEMYSIVSTQMDLALPFEPKQEAAGTHVSAVVWRGRQHPSAPGAHFVSVRGRGRGPDSVVDVFGPKAGR